MPCSVDSNNQCLWTDGIVQQTWNSNQAKSLACLPKSGTPEFCIWQSLKSQKSGFLRKSRLRQWQHHGLWQGWCSFLWRCSHSLLSGLPSSINIRLLERASFVVLYLQENQNTKGQFLLKTDSKNKGQEEGPPAVTSLQYDLVLLPVSPDSAAMLFVGTTKASQKRAGWFSRSSIALNTQRAFLFPH